MLKGSNSQLSSLSNTHLIVHNKNKKKSHNFFPGDVLKCFVPPEVKNAQKCSIYNDIWQRKAEIWHI